MTNQTKCCGSCCNWKSPVHPNGACQPSSMPGHDECSKHIHGMCPDNCHCPCHAPKDSATQGECKHFDHPGYISADYYTCGGCGARHNYRVKSKEELENAPVTQKQLADALEDVLRKLK